MPVRFRRTKSLLGGLIRLNVNKKSVSASVGIPGLGATLTTKGIHYHFGLPGTGLSYTGKAGRKNGRRKLGAS